MSREVLLTQAAERDLEELYRYIAEYDSPAAADHVLTRLLELGKSLSLHPDRGSTPKELQSLGMHECRQVFFKPYRVIYRVFGAQVVIYVIADSRRDMHSLLSRRLLDN